MAQVLTFHIVLFWGVLMLAVNIARAEPSPTMMGSLGLNTIPSARMDEAGTSRFGISRLSPYTHATLGFQFTDALYISMRQTAKGHSVFGQSDSLKPGVDIKLRLREENRYFPAIAIGLQSAIGDINMSGEYLTFSKKYKNLDVSTGIGWGRYGDSNRINNPLRIFGHHFQKKRDDTPLRNNTPSNWFSGDSIGFFGGAEYSLPITGLSLKLDYNSERYDLEKNADNFNPHPPWGIGLSYQPRSWFNASIGTQGAETLMANISLKTNMKKYWHRTKEKNYENNTLSDKALTNIKYDNDKIAGTLFLSYQNGSSPAQIGAAARELEAAASPETTGIEIQPRILGLRGPKITLPRENVKKSEYINGITPEELWESTEFSVEENEKQPNFNSPKKLKSLNSFFLTLDNHLDGSEYEKGFIYRTSVLAHAQTNPFLGYFSLGGALRLNLTDNLETLYSARSSANPLVRSDENNYAHTRFSLENLHLSYARSFTPQFHTLITSGYVDEQFFGAGSEFIYRPFGARFAIGADLWSVTKRDANSTMNFGLTAQNHTSAHVNAWYDLPRTKATLSASFGRFLGGDTGATVALEKKFDSGARVRGFMTLANARDYDISGNPLAVNHGIEFSIPLGGLMYLPEGSFVNTKISPTMRDTGQHVHAPLNLYDLTQNFTLDHMANQWPAILP